MYVTVCVQQYRYLHVLLHVCDKMAEKPTRRYKKYLRKADVTVPKTTKWRKHKREEHSNSVLNLDDHQRKSESTAKRRAYNRNASACVPRQTKWFWKMKKGDETGLSYNV